MGLTVLQRADRTPVMAQSRLPMRAAGLRAVATEPSLYQTPGHEMVPRWDADEAFRWGLYSNTWVYACNRANAEDLAATPFRAGGDPDDEGDWDPDVPLARLLGPPPGSPNPHTAPNQLWEWLVGQYRIAGRFAVEIEYDRRGDVIGLWPIPAQRIRPIPTSQGSQWFAGFMVDTGRGKKRLSNEQVWYHWKPSADDWREPESVLQASRLDVSVAVMQDRYDYAFIKNDARPAAVVVHEQFVDSEDKQAWRMEFEDRFSGPDNAGKVMFAEASPEGADVTAAIAIHQLGMSSRDAEFLKRYDQKIRAICVAFGTPMSRLGDSSQRTFSNADRETTNYWQTTMANIARDLEDAVNIKLAPIVGDEVGWFDFSDNEYMRKKGPLDDADPAKTVDKIVTVNEWREHLGLPRLDDPRADQLGTLIVTPATSTPALDPADDDPEPGPDPDEDEVDDELIDGQRIAEAQQRAVDRVDRITSTVEHQFERAFVRLFERMQAGIMSRLRGKRGRQAFREGIPSVDGVFDRDYWEAETLAVAGDSLSDVAAAAYSSFASRFPGISFDVTNTQVRAFIAGRANQLAGNVTQSTYSTMQQVMARGVENGLSIDDIADELDKLFTETWPARARTIARTEVIGAYNGANYQFAQLAGGRIVAGGEWLAAFGENPREHHSAAHGQIREVGVPFEVGDALLAYPGDGPASEVINCRCVYNELTPEEFFGRQGYSAKSVIDEIDAVLSGRL